MAAGIDVAGIDLKITLGFTVKSMMLTSEERRFLSAQGIGRLATIGPGGAPQVKPVGFRYNDRLGTIDIGGYNLAQSAKYKNIQQNPAVAFVVDDRPDGGLEGTRFLEIRGVAEAVPGGDPDSADLHDGASAPGLVFGPEIIRIHPRRVLSYNVDPAHPGLRTRDAAIGTAGTAGPGGVA
jgi:pyridoxamine 5'-phosphate oxidase family protein